MLERITNTLASLFENASRVPSTSEVRQTSISPSSFDFPVMSSLLTSLTFSASSVFAVVLINFSLLLIHGL